MFLSVTNCKHSESRDSVLIAIPPLHWTQCLAWSQILLVVWLHFQVMGFLPQASIRTPSLMEGEWGQVVSFSPWPAEVSQGRRGDHCGCRLSHSTDYRTIKNSAPPKELKIEAYVVPLTFSPLQFRMCRYYFLFSHVALLVRKGTYFCHHLEMQPREGKQCKGWGLRLFHSTCYLILVSSECKFWCLAT